jgi:signal recognition particle subunit SRP54
MGDIVGLVEKAADVMDEREAERLAAKMAKGKFDLDDFAKQLRQISKMGSISSIIGMLPGAGKLKQQVEDANIDTKVIGRQIAIISSMTMKERRNPDLIKASRKKRIASGSGVQVQDVNRLLKQFDEMTSMMKKMSKLGEKGLMRQGLQALMPKGMAPRPGMSRQRPF